MYSGLIVVTYRGLLWQRLKNLGRANMDGYELEQQLLELQAELGEKRILLDELEEQIDEMQADEDPDDLLKLEEERDELLTVIEELENEIDSMENQVDS